MNETENTQMRTFTIDCSTPCGHPIHHYGCIVVLCTGGSAAVDVNLKPWHLRRGRMLLLTSELYAVIRNASADFGCRCVELPDTVFNAVYYKITNVAFWDFLYAHPVMLLADDARRSAAEAWMQQMEWAVDNVSHPEVLTEMAAGMTYNLFASLESVLGPVSADARYVDKDRGWAIMSRFFSLLYRHFLVHHDVKFYASEMHISTDYLSKICRRLYGSSPKTYIDEMLVEEMKKLLSGTDLSVKQIAHALSFDDAPYMCRFFRRHVGLSPIGFRNSMAQHGPAGGEVGNKGQKTDRHVQIMP